MYVPILSRGCLGWSPHAADYAAEYAADLCSVLVKGLVYYFLLCCHVLTSHTSQKGKRPKKISKIHRKFRKNIVIYVLISHTSQKGKR
jgi:hypothetical protein